MLLVMKTPYVKPLYNKMALSHKTTGLISQNPYLTNALNSQNINSQIHIYTSGHKTLCHKKCRVCIRKLGLNVAKWYCSLHTCIHVAQKSSV